MHLRAAVAFVLLLRCCLLRCAIHDALLQHFAQHNNGHDNDRCRDGIVGLVAQVKSNAPAGTKSIIGESALTGGGGVNGTTNGFVSSMWYADWLAYAAKSGK